MSKNKKKVENKKLIIIATIVLIALAIFGFVFYKIIDNAGKKAIEVKDTIVLDAEYKNTDGKQIEIAKENKEEEVVAYFESLVDSKKSFVVYVSLPVCSGITAEFKPHVLEFQRRNSLSFYYLTSDYVKETSLYKTVKYFPSVITYKDGKIVNFLRYDSDEDLAYYQTYDNFAKWFEANVEF